MGETDRVHRVRVAVEGWLSRGEEARGKEIAHHLTLRLADVLAALHALAVEGVATRVSKRGGRGQPTVFWRKAQTHDQPDPPTADGEEVLRRAAIFMRQIVAHRAAGEQLPAFVLPGHPGNEGCCGCGGPVLDGGVRCVPCATAIALAFGEIT